MEKYASNSYRSKQELKNTEKKKVEAVIGGKTKLKKKSDVRKFFDSFLSDDLSAIKSYVVDDVLIPSAKKAMWDVITNSADILLYGEIGHSKKNTPGSKVSYSGYYNKNEKPSNRSRKRTYDYDTIEFETRGDAETVLMAMDELLDRYEVVTVADFYDLANVSDSYFGSYTDCNYGWYDLHNARIERTRNAYVIRLPRPKPIDD